MTLNFSRRLLLAIAVVTLAMASVSVLAQEQSSPTTYVKWLTYVDPRFDFSVKYPSNWQAIPRDDSDPNAVGGSLVFAPTSAPDNVGNADPHDPGPHVIVVPYLAELKDGQSLSEWTEMYESLGHESDQAAIQRQPRRIFRVNGAKAVHEEGVSPLTTYQFTNISRQNMVWDIWTNIPSTDPLANVYDRMVRSFRFGRNTPKKLRETYGSSFVPMDMEEVRQMNSEDQAVDFQGLVEEDQQGSGPQIYGLTDTWKSPILKTSTGALRDIQCGSKDHKDSVSYSYYAADINASVHTAVYNSKVGTVTFAGQVNNGYGTLVQVRANGGKEAYYAHLESISSYVVANLNKEIPTYYFIGWSGKSTWPVNPNFPPHLHFHVRWGDSSLNLTGMSGFYPDLEPNVPVGHVAWPGEPGSGKGASCGAMGR